MAFKIVFPLLVGVATVLSEPLYASTIYTGEAPKAAQGRPLLFAQKKQSSKGVCPARLGSAVKQVTDRAPAGRWGILVQTLGDRRTTLASINPTTHLVPASNNKLFTTAAALTKLGAQYRIRTSVYSDSDSPNVATLRILGRGDPSLTTAQLVTLVQQLRQKGVQQVTQLVGDDTYFRGNAVNPYWDREDTFTGYGAPVNSLMLNQNGIGLRLIPQQVGQPLQVQWDDPTDAREWILNNRSVTASAGSGEYVDAFRASTGRVIRIDGQLRAGSEPEPISVSVPNPGNYLISKFREALSNAGIVVNDATVVKSTPLTRDLTELAAIDSPPLSQLLIETNQESNNIYAEALLKTLGRVQSPTTLNATDSGIAAVKDILAPLGVNSAGYSMVDGSGLASRDRASAEAFVQTLQAMAQSPNAQVFRDSLSIAGTTGTLKKRFRNTPVQGRLFAKTGTISGVVSLSGYLTPPNYAPLAFSILVNHSSGSASEVRKAVDEIVLLLSRLQMC